MNDMKFETGGNYNGKNDIANGGQYLYGDFGK